MCNKADELRKELEDLKELVYDIFYNLPDDVYQQVYENRQQRRRDQQ